MDTSTLSIENPKLIGATTATLSTIAIITTLTGLMEQRTQLTVIGTSILGLSAAFLLLHTAKQKRTE